MASISPTEPSPQSLPILFEGISMPSLEYTEGVTVASNRQEAVYPRRGCSTAAGGGWWMAVALPRQGDRKPETDISPASSN